MFHASPLHRRKAPSAAFWHHVWTLHLMRIVHSGLPVACCCCVYRVPVCVCVCVCLCVCVCPCFAVLYVCVFDGVVTHGPSACLNVFPPFGYCGFATVSCPEVLLFLLHRFGPLQFCTCTAHVLVQALHPHHIFSSPLSDTCPCCMQ
jgi:hypothetical protein